MTSEFTPKNAKLFVCNICDFKCSKLSDFTRHNTTRKHKILTNTSEITPKSAENSVFRCNCGNNYRHRQSLYNHKKICTFIDVIDLHSKEDSTTDKELILTLLQQNNQLQTQIIELCKNGTTINNTNTNSNNKTFNLNFFLNETCKDAMNIMEFVDSIKLQLSDFERVGEVGFVNGISDIIIKNLKQLDITERPIHCTDKKRAIMYVKDDNKWEKDDDTNRKVRRAIKYIANKNIKLMDAYKALHPDCQKSHSIYSDSYNKFVIEALGGSGNEDCDNEDKIISRLSKVVAIEKV